MRYTNAEGKNELDSGSGSGGQHATGSGSYAAAGKKEYGNQHMAVRYIGPHDLYTANTVWCQTGSTGFYYPCEYKAGKEHEKVLPGSADYAWDPNAAR